jgi:hypothetical protein
MLKEAYLLYIIKYYIIQYMDEHSITKIKTIITPIVFGGIDRRQP